MGKMTAIAFALILTFSLSGIMMVSVFTGSPDPNKTQFVNYTPYKNFSQLNNENLTYPDTNDPKSNMQIVSEAIATKILLAQQGLANSDIATKILTAFGVGAAISLDLAGLLFSILIDGLNFIGGVAGNLAMLPTPWNYFGLITGLVTTLFIVYVALKIVATIIKVDA
jgi:Co/Zn/Cd efflux system component